MGGYANLQNQVELDPQQAVFEVWAQAKVAKAHRNCGERIGTSLGRFGCVVVEKLFFYIRNIQVMVIFAPVIPIKMVSDYYNGIIFF